MTQILNEILALRSAASFPEFFIFVVSWLCVCWHGCLQAPNHPVLELSDLHWSGWYNDLMQLSVSYLNIYSVLFSRWDWRRKRIDLFHHARRDTFCGTSNFICLRTARWQTIVGHLIWPNWQCCLSLLRGKLWGLVGPVLWSGCWLLGFP